MTSTVDICNSALNLIGGTNITSLTEDSKAARILNQRYNFVRDPTFRAHPCNCLITRRLLAQDSTAPVYRFAYKYALPTDPFCLRVLTISDDGDYERLDIDYQNEGNRFLLTDEGKVYLRYVGRDEDPNNYDFTLIETLAARLAADIAYPIVGYSSLARDMMAMYELKLRDARFSDAQEGPPDVLIAATYTTARL